MTSRGFLVKGLLAAALVFAVVAGIAALGERLGGADDSPVPATKKSVAAVAVEVLGIRPTSYDVNPRYDVPDPLGIEIRFKPPGDDGDSHYLYVSVNRYGVDDPSVCSEHYDCADWDGAGGSFHLAWQEEQPEEDPGILTLTFTTDHGERRSVTYAGNLIEGDPRDQDLPLSVEGDLVRLLTDDRLSATTTRDMVDTDLPKWPKDDTRGDAVPTTPAIVAQWMVENGARETAVKRPADTTAYGDGAVGAELVGKDHTTSVVLVPRGDPRVPTCGVGWNCETKRGVVRGWRPGVAIAIRETQDAVMLLTVRSDAIDALPRMRSRFGTAGEDYLALAVDWGAFNLQTTKEFADDVPPW